MGANTYTYSYAYAYAYAYPHTNTAPYPDADAYPNATAIFHYILSNNIDPVDNLDNPPFKHLDPHHQFVSRLINVINTDYHLLNHHDWTLFD